jgi:hypothetical protein
MSTAAEVACDGHSVTVRVPLALRRRGGRKQVVSPDGEAAWAPRLARVDSTLAKALARAHRWQGMLEGGEYGSIEELARAEKINPSYLARVLRLTLLAPDIVESILSGRHDPTTIRMERLMRPFSTTWGDQLQSFLMGRVAPAAASRRDGPFEQTRPQATAVAGAGPRPTSAKSHSRKAATLRRLAVASGQTR